MHFSRPERTFLLAVCVVSCLLGTFAGFFSLTDELHLQSCGVVLDEDVAAVMWRNTWITGLVFVEVALVVFVALGAMPMVLRRLLAKEAARDA
jgi:type III secretory pathway component EscT